MTTQEFVQKWLDGHLSPQAMEVSQEDFNHFFLLIVDICEAHKEMVIEEASKWLERKAELQEDKLKAFREALK